MSLLCVQTLLFSLNQSIGLLEMSCALSSSFAAQPTDTHSERYFKCSYRNGFHLSFVRGWLLSVIRKPNGLLWMPCALCNCCCSLRFLLFKVLLDVSRSLCSCCCSLCCIQVRVLLGVSPFFCARVAAVRSLEHRIIRLRCHLRRRG